VPALLAMLRHNADRDPYLRHAGVMGLTLIGDLQAVLAHAADRSSAARVGVLLALRRMESLEVRRFLRDRDPAVVREAARAINDVPLDGAVADLAALMDDRRAVTDPVVLPRIINANYRVGARQAAQALVTLASHGRGGRAAAEQGRRDALLALAAWSPPSSRDRVTGLWHPVPTASRDASAAANLLGPVIRPLLAENSASILEAAITAAATLKLGQAAPALASLVASRVNAPELRLQALRALASLSAPELGQSLNQASNDPALPVRLEALALKVKVQPERALDVARETLARGSIREQQQAVRIVADIPGRAADDVLARLAADLIAGALPPELTLDVLEAAARRKQVPALAAAVARFEAQRPKDDLGPYREALAGGDSEEGVAIFWKRADVACSRCHSFERQAGEVGPALRGVGRRSREYLLEAVVYPSKHFATGYHSVVVTMKDGTAHGGTVLHETGSRLTLRSPDGAPVTVDKADIKSREPGVSGMPEGFGQILSKRDLRNLVEFLATLRGR
jgi:quinoprotein glucose dehydrogenase